MERPFGLTLIAAYFFLQGMGALASAIGHAQRGDHGIAALLAAGAVLFLLTGAGLARMRKWGRALAIGLTAIGILLGLWFRVSGFPPGIIFAFLVTAGLILIYLTTHPSRSRFQ
jgi:uncharacterized membrane protein (DUF2068 family)